MFALKDPGDANATLPLLYPTWSKFEKTFAPPFGGFDISLNVKLLFPNPFIVTIWLFAKILPVAEFSLNLAINFLFNVGLEILASRYLLRPLLTNDVGNSA